MFVRSEGHSGMVDPVYTGVSSTGDRQDQENSGYPADHVRRQSAQWLPWIPSCPSWSLVSNFDTVRCALGPDERAKGSCRMASSLQHPIAARIDPNVVHLQNFIGLGQRKGVTSVSLLAAKQIMIETPTFSRQPPSNPCPLRRT